MSSMGTAQDLHKILMLILMPSGSASLVSEFLGELWVHSVCATIFDSARLQIMLTQFVVLRGKGLLKVQQRIVGMAQGLPLSGDYIVHYYGQSFAYPPSA